MLTFIWGVIALAAAAIAFVPAFRIVQWVDIPFAVAGAVVGILSIFGRVRGATRATIAGIAMCMIACLAGIFLLVLGGDGT